MEFVMLKCSLINMHVHHKYKSYNKMTTPSIKYRQCVTLMLQYYKFQYQHNCRQSVIVQHSTFSVGSFKSQVLAVAEALFDWNAHCGTIFTFPGTKNVHLTGHHGSIHLLRPYQWTTVFIQAIEGLQGAKKIHDYVLWSKIMITGVT